MSFKNSSVNTFQRRLLVYGYCRHFEANHSLSSFVPHSIYDLIVKYYPNMIVYPGIFEDKNHGSSITIIDDHRISMNGWVSSIRLSFGISISDLNNYYWYFKIESSSKQNGYHFMGVCTNLTSKFKENPFSGLNDCWGISGNPALVFLGGSQKGVSDFGKVIIDRLIRIEYYAQSKQLKFKWADNKCDMTNNGWFYTIQLDKDRKDITHYYPCMGIANKNNLGFLYKEVPKQLTL